MEREAEIKFVKDMIADERVKREHQLDDHYKLYQHL